MPRWPRSTASVKPVGPAPAIRTCVSIQCALPSAAASDPCGRRLRLARTPTPKSTPALLQSRGLPGFLASSGRRLHRRRLAREAGACERAQIVRNAIAMAIAERAHGMIPLLLTASYIRRLTVCGSPYGRTAGLSIGMPRARHIRNSLERDVFGRAVGIGLGAHADQAVAQPPLQRAERLPFQPVERIAGRMRLRDRRCRRASCPSCRRGTARRRD